MHLLHGSVSAKFGLGRNAEGRKKSRGAQSFFRGSLGICRNCRVSIDTTVTTYTWSLSSRLAEEEAFEQRRRHNGSANALEVAEKGQRVESERPALFLMCFFLFLPLEIIVTVRHHPFTEMQE